jgi:hypothetical protein
VRFTRRDVRDATNWSDSQLKVHCARLADMEYLLVHGGSRGHSLTYELLWDGESDAERRLCGLIDSDALDGMHDDCADDVATPASAKLPIRPPQVWAVASQVWDEEAQVWVKSAPSLGQVWVKSDPMNQAQGRMDTGLQPATPLNGGKPHSSGHPSLAAGPVIATAITH